MPQRTRYYPRAILISLLALSAAMPAVCQDTEQREGLRENRPGTYALTNVRVVVSPERTLESATVVVRNGRIAAIGEQVPDDARVLDMSGRTLYPGFIDSYSEVAQPNPGPQGAVYWNPNVTPQLRVADTYAADASTNKKYRSQGIVARLAAPAGGIIKGQSALVQTHDQPARHAVLAEPALHVRLTVQRRRRGTEGPSYPNSPMGAYALARQAFYDTDWYRAAWKAVRTQRSSALPERNDALQAMLPYLDGSRPVIIDSSNELYALRADRFGREFGLNVVIHGSGNEYRRIDEILATGRTVIVPLNFPKPPNVATAESALGVSLESLMHWDLAPENPARLDAAGVPIVLTAQGLDKTGDFLSRVRQAIKRGLDKNSALRAMTQRPAELLGVSELLGTIERGKLASFLVTDGDLFDEKTKVLETWVAGERFRNAPQPLRDIQGDWRLKVSGAGRRPAGFLLKVTGTPDKPAATVRPPGTAADSDKAVKLSRIALRDVQFSGTFSADKLGVEGVVRFSLALDDADRATGRGLIVWPDGTRMPLTATRLAVSTAEDTADKPKPGKDKPAEEGQSLPADVDSRPASFAVNFPLGAWGRETEPPQETVVFRNATVWTCGPDGVLEETDVLIRDGKIAAIGPDLPAEKGVQEIDLQGRHLSPGIIDCHSHMATDGGVNESGQAITAEVRIGDFIDCDDITIFRQLATGVTSSNILHGSANPIGGQNQVIKLRWGATPEQMKFAQAPQGIKFALGENVKQSNWSNPTNRYPQTRMGVEQLFRDEFTAAREYRQRWTQWKTTHRGLPPRYDLELEAIAEILEGSRWIHCHSYRQDEILALIRVLDDFEITIGSFQHILEGYKVADAMARHGATGSAFADWWAYKFEVTDAIPFAGAIMHQQGVVVSFNSDDGELATHLNQEAAKAVKYGGVEPEEALKFVTLNPAKQLRIDRWVGSVEVGKDADLVVWNHAPLSNFARAEQTWVDGRRYFDREADVAARAGILSRRATLIQKILQSGEEMRKPGVGDGDPAALWPREDLFCGHHSHDDHDEGHDH